MDFDTLYLALNLSVMPAWLCLIFLPKAKVTRLLVHSAAVPFVLGIAYCFLIFGADVEGGTMANLTGVMHIFDNPQATIGAWVHYLIFDLFIGSWEARDAERRGVPHWQLVPCLALTLFFGPVGLMLYFLVRLVNKQGLLTAETSKTASDDDGDAA